MQQQNGIELTMPFHQTLFIHTAWDCVLFELSYVAYKYRGETTLPEHFFEYDTDGFYGESKNHHFMGDVVQWFMRYPGGLNVTRQKVKFPNSESEERSWVYIKPCFIKGMDYCHVTQKLPDGHIDVLWQRDGDEFDMTVECSGKVAYKIIVDEGYEDRLISRTKYRIRKKK